MKSPATFRRRLNALALALALLTVASHAVGDEAAPRSYSVWRGPIVVKGSLERLSATLAVVSVDGESIAVGTLSNDDGVRLTYIDSPLDDRPMVAVMRAPVDLFGLVELWSDGTCDHLEILRKNRQIPLWESASRIVEAMPKGSQEALRILQNDPVMKRAAAELTDGFAKEPESDEHPAASPRYEEAIPELFEHLRGRVLDRFADSQAVIAAIDGVKPSLRLEPVATSPEEGAGSLTTDVGR